MANAPGPRAIDADPAARHEALRGETHVRPRPIPRRYARLAGSQLPAGNARADSVGKRHVLGRAQMDVPERGAEAMAGGDGGVRLDGARLAQGLWRRRPVAGRNQGAEAG